MVSLRLRKNVINICLIGSIILTTSGCDNMQNQSVDQSTLAESETLESTLNTEVSHSDDVKVIDSVEIETELNGIVYQLGESNHTYQSSTIKVKGNIEEYLDATRSLEGVVIIDGKSYQLRQVKSVATDTNILLYEGFITYASEAGYTRTLGQIFLNSDVTQIAICDEQDGWSNKDGKMLSYPSTTKKEALEVANNVMINYLAALGISNLQ